MKLLICGVSSEARASFIRKRMVVLFGLWMLTTVWFATATFVRLMNAAETTLRCSGCTSARFASPPKYALADHTAGCILISFSNSHNMSISLQ